MKHDELIEIPGITEIRFFCVSVRGGAEIAKVFCYCQSGRWMAKVYIEDYGLTWVQQPEENSLKGIKAKVLTWIKHL